MITSFTEYINLLDNEEHPASQRALLDEVSENVLFRTIRERPDLKQWVILNKRVPDIILASLVDDPEKYVRMWVARKRKLSMVSLEKLANDRADVVRREVVHHRKINRQILNILAQDEEPDIADIARKRIEQHDYKS